jgi:hypothetical protein
MYVSSGHNCGGIIYPLAGGPILLVWGLRKLYEKRLIENTPVSKVRSAAMGLVELSGMARLRKPQKSPLSNMDACWWNCSVQELRSNGKNSHWATIKQVGSVDLFYLDDTTGRVLVNPFGAELHVLNNTFELNAMTRTQIAPVLNGWGLNDMSWFGLERRMRIIEQVIPDCAPLFVMGELISLGEHLEDRQARFNARLRAIKADPVKMAEADTNHDGMIDPEEWDAFRAKQEEEFLKEEMSKQAAMPNQDSLLVKAPGKGAFVVSTESEEDLVSSFQWMAPLAVFGGVALTGVGAWLAILAGWNPFFIVGLSGIGLAIGLCVKQFSLTSITVRR